MDWLGSMRVGVGKLWAGWYICAMTKLLHVREILRRSGVGITRPFLCTCEDGHKYFVKGRSAGKRSLVSEWLAGNLGRAFGLPIPPFGIVKAPRELLGLHPEGADLGVEAAFASRLVDPAQEFTRTHSAQVDPFLKRDVLVFDWWVRNADRTLGLGGNPNLLWSSQRNELVVIDHNLAFDDTFDETAFCADHIFSEQIPVIRQDFIELDDWRARMCRALECWAAACHTMPAEWLYLDDENVEPIDFDLRAVRKRLDRFRTDEFWRFRT